MSVVLLLRHGQASFGAADYDVLSPRGEHQSTVLGEELLRREVEVDQVWSGTMQRQQRTAAIATKAAGIDLARTVDERWNEYDHLGLVEHLVARGPDGAPVAPRDFQRILDQALHDWIVGSHEAGATGSFRQFTERIRDVLGQLVSGLGRGETAAVFTSGGVISAVCAELLGLPPQGFLAMNRVVVNAGVTKLVHGRSGTSLVSFNEHGHFDGPGKELLSYR